VALQDAVRDDGSAAPPLPPGPPYRARELRGWAGFAFDLPPGDERLRALHEGHPAPSPPLDNLVGMARAWVDHPEWLDFLDPSAPNHADKLLERALYLHHWDRWLPGGGARVLDLGAGTGRFTTWFLDHACDVEAVDPDLRSLWRLLQHAAGRAGRLDVHWTTAERLPDLEPVDAVVAAEVLCYVEDPARALAAAAARVRPGGVLLGSVEARVGWVSALDAAPDTLQAWLDDGVVHVPGDRWIRTYDESTLRNLLGDWELLELVPTHYAVSGPFEAAAGPLALPALLEVEDRLRKHPLAKPWHRAWLFAARPPG